MGSQGISRQLDAAHLRAFTRALLDDVEALERMLDSDLFETGIQRIGAEQEMFLVDAQGEPIPIAPELLERLGHGPFCAEIGRFDLEANLQPRLFTATCLSDLEAELRAIIAQASAAAREFGARVVLTGILPTIDRSHLIAENLSPGPRYAALNQATLNARGGDVHIAIKGLDALELRLDSMMMESCLTSFQVHLQVSPADFARTYNWSQAAIAPVLAAAVNAPILLGKRLWHETRIPLFETAAEFRTMAQQRRGAAPRVGFGSRWIEESVVELFREDIARHRVLLASDLEELSSESVQNGRAPKLKALSIHNGTVWRWNRACYGVADGKAHLRIENRVIPSGPTVLDEVANAAFWLGLMVALPNEYGDVRKHLLFPDALTNFFGAAQYGLNTELVWMGGERISASRLIVDRLLPLAREGLREVGVHTSDVMRSLSVIESRVRARQTGAQWMLDAFNSYPVGVPITRRNHEIVSEMLDYSPLGEPVHTWEPFDGSQLTPSRVPVQTVGQAMTTDVFTVKPSDSVELASSVMRWRELRVMPVEGDNGQLVGIVTRKALLRHLSRHCPGTSDDTVDAVMSPPAGTVPVNMPIVDALDALLASDSDCLLVVQGSNELVGVVTERNLLKALRAQMDGAPAQPPIRLVEEETPAELPLPGEMLH